MVNCTCPTCFYWAWMGSTISLLNDAYKIKSSIPGLPSSYSLSPIPSGSQTLSSIFEQQLYIIFKFQQLPWRAFRCGGAFFPCWFSSGQGHVRWMVPQQLWPQGMSLQQPSCTTGTHQRVCQHKAYHFIGACHPSHCYPSDCQHRACHPSDCTQSTLWPQDVCRPSDYHHRVVTLANVSS